MLIKGWNGVERKRWKLELFETHDVAPHQSQFSKASDPQETFIHFSPFIMRKVLPPFPSAHLDGYARVYKINWKFL